MNYFCLAFPEKGEQWVEGGKHKTAGAMLPHRTIKPCHREHFLFFRIFQIPVKGREKFPQWGEL